MTIGAAATRRISSLAAATAAAPAALPHARRVSLFSPSSLLTLSSRRAFSSSAKDAEPAVPVADADSASNPFAADSDLWQLDTGGISLSGGALDQSAPESYGVVMGVNKGIVSVDGVHTAHIGSCLQFFSKEDVRHSTRAKSASTSEQQQMFDVTQLARHLTLASGLMCLCAIVLSSRRRLPRGVWLCRSTAISPRP